MKIAGGKGLKVFMEQVAGGDADVQTMELPGGSERIELKIQAAGRTYSFLYRVDSGEFKPFGNADGSVLSTYMAGGFQGVVLGMFARTNQ